MSSVSGIAAHSSSPITSSSAGRPLMKAEEQKDLKAAFQHSVAGLFFGQMMKSLRQGVGKPAYIHGGQAEDMFQSQMDQMVAENLATQHGGALVEDLYQRFLIDHPENTPQSPPSVASLAKMVRSAPTEESAQVASWAPPTTSISRNTTGTGVISALNRK